MIRCALTGRVGTNWKGCHGSCCIPPQGESSEESKLDPWTVLAKYKLKAEEALKNVPGLNYVILRPAIVYGTGDKQGLSEWRREGPGSE